MWSPQEKKRQHVPESKFLASVLSQQEGRGQGDTGRWEAGAELRTRGKAWEGARQVEGGVGSAALERWQQMSRRYLPRGLGPAFLLSLQLALSLGQVEGRGLSGRGF